MPAIRVRMRPPSAASVENYEFARINHRTLRYSLRNGRKSLPMRGSSYSLWSPHAQFPTGAWGARPRACRGPEYERNDKTRSQHPWTAYIGGVLAELARV